MQLVGDQVKSCGFDIQYKETDFAALLNMLTTFPHINAAAPESGKPFDAYFGGFSTGLRPGSVHRSTTRASARPPSSPIPTTSSATRTPKSTSSSTRVLVEFDQAKRAEIYQEYAVLQSNDLPVLYAWADIAREGLRKTVDTTAEVGSSSIPRRSPGSSRS